jgi:aryl-alcohol dehydrogenase
MQIRAAIAHPASGEFAIDTVELDAPREDEILVAIKAVGVCHTDLVALQGGFGFGIPAVLGHEGAGVVEQIGAAVSKVAPGDRVAISFRSCGACHKCGTGHPAYCETMPLLNYAGMRPDGSRAIRHRGVEIASNFFGQSSFASHALTYERNVVKLDADTPFAVAAPLGCGIQTGAGSIINAFGCEAGSALLVTGAGTVGLSAVMAGRIRGCAPIVVVEPVAARRDLALELGATHAIDPSAAPDLAAAVRAIKPLGIDYALDTTARGHVLAAIMNALAPQGTLGCVGVPAPGSGLPGDLNTVLALGQKVMGIIEGDSDPDRFIPQLLDHYRQGRLPLDRLITTYNFADINRAIADQHAGLCIKIVLTMD